MLDHCHGEGPNAWRSTPVMARAGSSSDITIIYVVVCSKLRTDVKVRDVYKLGKTLGTGGEPATSWNIQACAPRLWHVHACITRLQQQTTIRLHLRFSAGFSVVKHAEELATGDVYACKIMALPPLGSRTADGESTREDIFKEIEILVGLNDINVVYLKEYFQENEKVLRAFRSAIAPCLGLRHFCLWRQQLL